jgi:hypothetical protein
MGMRNYLIEGLSGTTKAIRKPADRRMTPHTNTTSGMWTK